MTAIAGWIGSSPDTSQRNIQALLDGLSIYGTAAPQFNTLGPAAFGRSLTPTLPEDDPREPPLIGGGKVMLAADVRIDNRSELIARLGTDAVRATAQSDSALLLEAWLKWGEQCLDHIVGDFAFAIWDDERRQLIMARDATGQRPLFFATTDTAIAFASMPSGLTPCRSLGIGFSFPRLAASMIGSSQFSPDRIERMVSLGD